MAGLSRPFGFQRTFLGGGILVLAVAMVLLLVPLVDCPTCAVGIGIGRKKGTLPICPVCKDRARVSLVTRWMGDINAEAR